MNIKQLSSDGKIAYLIKPILKVLQEAGGQLERSEIKARIADMDDQIAEFAEIEKKSKKTGNTYKEFNFKFNFAIKDLFFIGLLTYTDTSPITLTEKGLYLDVDTLDVEKDVIEASKKHWEQLSQNNKKNKVADISDNEEEMQEEEKIKDDFKEKLLAAIAKMTPKKFEAFSRALLNRMGVEFTEKGVQISNDGGIDGYGYHTDTNDFRTTRVVIQCKRYNVAPVREPEINQFLGAMNKYQADYGVFITNGRFTNSARQAAREGSPITLIDGNDLVKLVIKYELYITPVKTYASVTTTTHTFVMDDVFDIVEEKVNVSRYGKQVIDWIRIDDLPNQPLDIEEIRTQPANEVEGTFFEVQEGDILVARLGPTILNQKIVMVRSLERTTIASAEFLVLRCRRGYDPEAVMAVLKTGYYRDLMAFRL